MLGLLDWIEFDRVNGKIITRHNTENILRFWDLATYMLCYEVTTDGRYREIFICNGVFGILEDYNSGFTGLQATFYLANCGLPIRKIIMYVSPHLNFMQQFNHKLLSKDRNSNQLKIYDSEISQFTTVENFGRPEALIPLHVKDLLFNIQQGKFRLFNSDGTLLTDFN